MVKNTGGNKSKKVARKNVSSFGTRDVRRATDENEVYASVSKIFSSQRCSVVAADGKTYQCNVRGKFLKNKRAGGGELSPGVWVLIGFYDWEVRSDGSRNCDLLEIYTPIEKDKLKQLEPHKLSVLMKIDGADLSELAFSNFNTTEETKKDEENDQENDEENVVTNYMKMPYQKEKVEDQMDWLSVDVRDI